MASTIYNITFETVSNLTFNFENGSSNTAYAGSTVYFSITANAGYTASAVRSVDGNTTITYDAYTQLYSFTMPSAAITITATSTVATKSSHTVHDIVFNNEAGDPLRVEVAIRDNLGRQIDSTYVTYTDIQAYATKRYVNDAIKGIYRFRGSVLLYADLPSYTSLTADQKSEHNGEVYNVAESHDVSTTDSDGSIVTTTWPAGTNYVYEAENDKWSPMGGFTLDTSTYITSAELESKLTEKNYVPYSAYTTFVNETNTHLSTIDTTLAQKQHILAKGSHINIVENSGNTASVISTTFTGDSKYITINGEAITYTPIIASYNASTTASTGIGEVRPSEATTQTGGVNINTFVNSTTGVIQAELIKKNVTDALGYTPLTPNEISETYTLLPSTTSVLGGIKVSESGLTSGSASLSTYMGGVGDDVDKVLYVDLPKSALNTILGFTPLKYTSGTTANISISDTGAITYTHTPATITALGSVKTSIASATSGDTALDTYLDTNNVLHAEISLAQLTAKLGSTYLTITDFNNAGTNGISVASNKITLNPATTTTIGGVILSETKPATISTIASANKSDLVSLDTYIDSGKVYSELNKSAILTALGNASAAPVYDTDIPVKVSGTATINW
jgi:hypothetical protein